MKKTFQTGNVLTVSLAHMVHDTYSAFLAPVLPLLIEKLGLSYSQVGLLSVVQRAPSLLNPLVGLIADKLSVRYFIIAAPSITAVSMSLLGVAPSYTVLTVLLFVMGIASTLFHVPAPVMIKETSGDRIGRGMSFYMLGGELARTLGPLIILAAVSIWGLEGTWKLIPLGLAASLILYFRVKNIKISDKFKREKKDAGAREVFVRFMPLFITMAGITFFSAFTKGALTTFLPTYLHMKGESIWMAGISLSVLEGAGAFGAMLAGTLSDKIGRRNMMLIICTASPVFMWAFISCSSIFTLPLLLVLGFFLFATGPVMLAQLNDMKTERPAFINGIYMTLNFSISAATIMCIGVLGDVTGLENTYMIAAAVSLGSIPFVMRLPG